MTRRRLRPDERELWLQVAHSTKPLPEALRREKKAAKTPIRPKPEKEPISLARAFGIGIASTAPTGPVVTEQSLRSSAISMDKKTFGKMRRGKLVPEARIDLHGMTLDQAHPALTRFILTSWSRGFRLVLVITGKGQRDEPHDPMPRQRGVLRRQVPLWLRMPPLNGAVLEMTDAHIRHGGDGAFYVYLRKAART